ncbi:MAG TPA: enoyl-CoA hydratase/isomerase family protein [Frankiaceae bacterium]|nr:enoyl-CoA hydratase/isomerase family protein [Frankiaceae bacterium]
MSPSSSPDDLPSSLADAVAGFLGDDVWSRAGLRLERDGPVVTIALARPEKRNAQRPETWLALDAVGRLLPGDVRVVVVRGDGPSFSAGIDLSVLAEQAGGDLPDADRIAGYQAGFTWLGRADLLSVAVVSGHAVGAGFQLALACDLRLIGDDALLSMAETSRGLVPDLGGTEALVHLVGYGRAFEMCLTGRRVGATEAVSIGLATMAVSPAELDDALADLIGALLAAPRDAAVETKALLLRARDLAGGRAGQLAAEREAQVRRVRALAGLGD